MTPEQKDFYRQAKLRASDPEGYARAMAGAKAAAEKNNERQLDRKRRQTRECMHRARKDPVRGERLRENNLRWRNKPILCDDGKVRTQGAAYMWNRRRKDPAFAEKERERQREYRNKPDVKAKRDAFDREIVTGRDGKERTRHAERFRNYRHEHPEQRVKRNAYYRGRVKCEDGKWRTQGSRYNWLRKNPQWRREGFKLIHERTEAA